MPKLSREDFLKELFVSRTSVANTNADKTDAIFNKYANKTLPKAYKTTAYLEEYTGTWGSTQVKHLLRRTVFGLKEADIQSLLGMTMSDAVDHLLNNIPALPTPPQNDYTPNGTKDVTGVPNGASWVTAPVGDGNVNDVRRYAYKKWWTGQMINQNLSIQEKMVFFWHNHFATQTYVVGDARFSYNNNVLIRTNALGNFKTLVKSVTKDCAMLMYLNGNENTKNQPDENYAREVQELFTLGKENGPHYTEDDVKAAARILTGWSVNNTTMISFFVPKLHDTSDKQFSDLYNSAVIKGRSGQDGMLETDELIDMIFSKAATAHYICAKLYRFFVYYNIDAEIDKTVITPLAQLLIDNNFEIKPVISRLLKSEHFYTDNNIGCYIRTPLDLLIGTFRTFDIEIPPGIDTIQTYAIWNYVLLYSGKLGLDIGDPPNVAGWQPFYEAPAYHEIWINSNTLPLRMAFTDMMLTTGFSVSDGPTISIDVLRFTRQYQFAQNPDSLINHFTSLLLGVSISESEHDRLKSILLSGQLSNGYWAQAWESYLAEPNEENISIVKGRLTELLMSILRYPEHQLC